MYLRTTQRRNKDGSVVRYHALAENVRHPEKGYVEARVVHSFGRADQLDRAALERLVASIQRVLADAGSGPVTREGASLGRIAIEASFELGVVHVAKALWAKLGIGEAIQARLDEQQLTAPHAAALLAMVAQRLDRPGSKLACHERWLDRVWLPEARDLGLYQLYRALDVLALHGDAIEQAVFWRAVDLFKLDVDLVFYDGTTAWFECDEEDVASQEWRGLTFEPLRKRGHSKEGRDNDPQVVIALAVTRDGVPVRSWVFPGNTPDVTTVQTIKDDLRAIESRENTRAPVVRDHRGHRSVGNRIDPWRLVQREGVDLSNRPAGLPDHLRDHTPRPQQIKQAAHEPEEREHRRDQQDHVYADRQARHDFRAIATNRAERHQREDRGRDEDAQRMLHDGMVSRGPCSVGLRPTPGGGRDRR
jgi:hypothetical protein